MSIKKELDELLQTIARFSDGVSVEELLRLLATPKRTLQYRLSKLVKTGAIKAEGSGRSRKYYVEQGTESAQDLSRKSVIPLSQEGRQVQQLISAPVPLRPHVSYQREFLDSYVPNQTFYLTESMREKLSKLGAGSEKNRPAGTYAQKIYQRLLVDLSWNSSRLEGNTYSLLETEKLLETGEEAPGKNHKDAQMILNHKEAIEFLVGMGEEIDINRYVVLNIHGLLSQGLILNPQACGKLRTTPVKIGQSVYHPLEMPQLIEDYFQKIVQKAAAIKNPFEQSFFIMVHLPYLQPFLDVNKRVSRIVGNIPFIKENLSPLCFVDVPEPDYIQGLLAIYEMNRIELFRDVFVWAYERSASLYLATLEVIGPPDPFRMRYRELIREAVFEVVQQKMGKFQASHFISTFAREQLPSEDRARFIEMAEQEVMSLHEGNIARFRIKPYDLSEWQKEWK